MQDLGEVVGQHYAFAGHMDRFQICIQQAHQLTVGLDAVNRGAVTAMPELQLGRHGAKTFNLFHPLQTAQ